MFRKPTRVEIVLACSLVAGAAGYGIHKWRQPRLRYLSDFAHRFDPTHMSQSGYIQIVGSCIKPSPAPNGTLSQQTYVVILMDIDTKTGKLYTVGLSHAPESFKCPE